MFDFVVGTCKYPHQSLHCIIISCEFMVSAQAPVAIDQFCPAFTGR